MGLISFYREKKAAEKRAYEEHARIARENREKNEKIALFIQETVNHIFNTLAEYTRTIPGILKRQREKDEENKKYFAILEKENNRLNNSLMQETENINNINAGLGDSKEKFNSALSDYNGANSFLNITSSIYRKIQGDNEYADLIDFKEKNPGVFVVSNSTLEEITLNKSGLNDASRELKDALEDSKTIGGATQSKVVKDATEKINEYCDAINQMWKNGVKENV